jgi:uncharacterized protein YndB with AHSA1/START domain
MSALIHEFACTTPASVDQVFTALTDPAALKQWFAEHVELDLRPDGAYRFWGRYSYDTPTADSATQRLLAVQPSGRLAFTWRIHGRDSEVSLVLLPDDDEKNAGGTRLKGEHRFETAPAIGRAAALIDDLWRIHCGNLQAFLAGGAGISRPDFGDADPKVSASILIDAPVERVFASFLDPASLNRWIASAAEVEPTVGGRYRYGWNYTLGERAVEGGPTRILELVENEKLVTDWPDWRGDPDVPGQRVSWLFEPVGTHTRVTVVHDGFVRAVDISDYPFGWPYFLGMLKPVFETPESGSVASD